MTKMIENAKKQNDVELFSEFVHVVHGQLTKFDIISQRFGGEMRLRKVSLVEIHSEHAISAAPFHLNAVEPGIATNVEYRFTAQICRDSSLESRPFHARIVSEKVLRRSLHTPDFDVVKPLAERADVLGNVRAFVSVDLGKSCIHVIIWGAAAFQSRQPKAPFPSAPLSKFIASR